MSLKRKNLEGSDVGISCMLCAPAAAHGGELRKCKEGTRCRLHWPDKRMYREGTGALQLALPAFAEGRLLCGRGHCLHGPGVKPLVFAFVVENLRKVLRSMRQDLHG